MVLVYGAGDGGVVWGVYDFRAGVAGWESEFGYGELDVFVSDLGGVSFVYWCWEGADWLQVGVFGFFQYAVGVVSALGLV